MIVPVVTGNSLRAADADRLERDYAPGCEQTGNVVLARVIDLGAWLGAKFPVAYDRRFRPPQASSPCLTTTQSAAS